MNSMEIITELTRITETVRTAVLATVDRGGNPHVRWVTPGLLPHHPGSIFMVTSPSFSKVADVESNPHVEWLFQTFSLDTVITVRGTMRVLANAALRSEVLEALASRLRTFWTVNLGRYETVILETSITEAIYFLPTKGVRETVRFEQGGDDGNG